MGNLSAVTPSAISENNTSDSLLLEQRKAVTNNSATTVATLNLTSGSIAAGLIRYVVEVTDGTDYQTESGILAYSALNKGGVVTVGGTNGVTAVSSQNQVTTGTLAVTWTLTTGGLLRVNANSSLTPSAGYPRVTLMLENLTQQAVTVS